MNADYVNIVCKQAVERSPMMRPIIHFKPELKITKLL